MSNNHPISTPQAWLLAARPETLPAAVAPVLVGTALAYVYDAFSWLPALTALGGALLIQIGTNFANDYFDFFKGIDNVERKGPTRVVQSGLIPPGRLRNGMLLVFSLATALGTYLVTVAGWPIVVIGLASLLCAVLYSGGPYPLSAHGLGDVFVFIFFGLIAVCGTYYVQALSLSSWVLLAAVPVGTLTTAIIVVNNLRDIETDERAGKRTLAVRVGKRTTCVEYVMLLVSAYLIPILMWAFGWPSAWVLLPGVSIPLAISLILAIYQAKEGSTFNKVLTQTAQLALLFSVLFSVGLLLR